MNIYINSFEFNEHIYYYYDLKKLFEYYPSLKSLPLCLKILLESNLRNTKEDINSIIKLFSNRVFEHEIDIYPLRVICEEKKAISTLVDIASYKEYFKDEEEKIEKISPKLMFDFISDKNKFNAKFLKWCKKEFDKLTVLSSNEKSYEDINLELLSTMISSTIKDEKIFIFPELVVGVDEQSYITNALGNLSYKLNTIQMQEALLGSIIKTKLPKVVGIHLSGSFTFGVGIDDLIFYIKNILKEKQIENSTLEFCGDSLKYLLIEDRACLTKSLSNSSNQIYFPVDENSFSYIEQTRAVDSSLIKEFYTKQGLVLNSYEITYDENILIDLSLVKTLINKSDKSSQKINIKELPLKFISTKKGNYIKDNDIVLSLISSSSSITLLIQAALLAKKAFELGLSINSKIKKVLNIQSTLQYEILKNLNLLSAFENLAYELNINSIDINKNVSLDIQKFNLNAVALINKEVSLDSEISSLVKSKWEVSAALNIAYCLKGNINTDITSEAIIADIFLSDIWPSTVEVNEYLQKVQSLVYSEYYKVCFPKNEDFLEESLLYSWEEKSTHIQKTELFNSNNISTLEIKNAKILAIFEDNISTQEIMPKGNIFPYSSAAVYLQEKGLRPDEFDTFESRMGDNEFMQRVMFSNIELRNLMVHPKEGGYTKDFESFEILPIYEYCMKMKEQNKDLVIFAGKNFGVGRFKQWACKGIKSLGIKAIIANSFNEEYRKGLISLGVLPLQFIDDNIHTLNLKGDETFFIKTTTLNKEQKLIAKLSKENEVKNFEVILRLDSLTELEDFKQGGTLSRLIKTIVE